MKKIAIVLGVLILASFWVLLCQIRSSKSKYEVAMANIKSYDQQLSTATERNLGLQLTIDQLNTFQDSILVEMNKVRNELDIKDKNLKSLQYLTSKATKVDTILTVDTLFRDRQLSTDSTIGDAWYKVRVQLKYPNFIALTPFFISKKYVVISSKRETINPPKKFFLLRWFQKKHTVVSVDIKELNPYIEDGEGKYVEIVK